MPDFGVAIPVSGHRTANMFSKAILGIGRAAQKMGNQSKSGFDKAARSGSRFGDIVKGVLAANIIRNAANRLWDFAKGAITLSSDLTEVQNVVDTTFGAMSATIDKWSRKAITQFGLSELEAKKFTGALGAMIKSSGISGNKLVEMSTNLTGLVGDFASFYNLRIDEAFEKVKAAMAGSTEPMLALGINMQVANLEAFALSKGITKSWKSMTQAEKTLLRYNFLLDKSKDAQGDFNKTLGTSFANQQRVFMTKIKQASARLFSKLLPSLIDAFKSLNAAIDSIDIDKFADMLAGIVPIIKALIKTFIFLVKVVTNTVVIWGPLLAGLIAYTLTIKGLLALNVAMTIFKIAKAWFMLSRMTSIATATQLFFNTAMMANPVGLVIAAVAALITLLAILILKWDAISMWLDTVTAKLNKFGIVGKAIAFILRLSFLPLKLLIDGIKKLGGAYDYIKSKIGLGGKGEKPSKPEPPNKRDVEARQTNVNVQTDINVTGPPGTKATAKTRGAPRPNMRKAGRN